MACIQKQYMTERIIYNQTTYLHPLLGDNYIKVVEHLHVSSHANSKA